jgi:putative protein kinase ArgK-like GTPase of G3E family
LASPPRPRPIIAMAGDSIQVAKAGLMMIHNTQWISIGDRHDMAEAAQTMKVFDETSWGCTKIGPAPIATRSPA